MGASDDRRQEDIAYQLNLQLRAEQGKPPRQYRRHIPLNTRRAGEAITEEEYQELSKHQNGQCAVCGYMPPFPKRLHVDHCHRTGGVRGLLCSKCNLGLGLLADDPKRCAAAARYLKQNHYRIS